ncbi:MAG: helix-hairpin-helix domain-containing protein [Dictyoglomus sp.]|nr:helix-hairpin-helix domain-containing protein [Dictyoglomus sp.]MCX7942778.1 helix-hairpin-helix domain-containing protein [Dictyoglomaceae bacterium]MDW8188414.1 Holliday junction branch migration protein RuvA [Dictyoglomus sp.]
MSFLNHIQGKIIDVSNNFLILSLGDISFRIKGSKEFLEALKSKIGEEIKIYISEILEEKEISLIGFIDKEKRDFFEELLSLSGVGVKLALRIVENITLQEWRVSLESDNWEILTIVPGIGKKLAQRIFFSAKKSLPIEEREEKVDIVMEALNKLGYSKKQVNKISRELLKEKEKSPEELLKIALEKLRKEL